MSLFEGITYNDDLIKVVKIWVKTEHALFYFRISSFKYFSSIIMFDKVSVYHRFYPVLFYIFLLNILNICFWC